MQTARPATRSWTRSRSTSCSRGRFPEPGCVSHASPGVGNSPIVGVKALDDDGDHVVDTADNCLLLSNEGQQNADAVSAKSPPTFTWRGTGIGAFRVELSTGHGFPKLIPPSKAFSTDPTFTPTVAQWKKVVKKLKKAQILYWRIAGQPTGSTEVVYGDRTLSISLN